ncbi:hypothetical protein [Trinickia soli]|uniref:hypothetical protein n=1 Tax=Trinickia soli TaxID=380675 RepID=UPI003FA3BE63
MRTSHGRAVIIILYLLFLLLAYDLRDTARISPMGHAVYLAVALSETVFVTLSVAYRTQHAWIRCGFNRDFVLFTTLATQCSISPFVVIFFATSPHVAFMLGLQIFSVLSIGLGSLVEAFVVAILVQ